MNLQSASRGRGIGSLACNPHCQGRRRRRPPSLLRVRLHFASACGGDARRQRGEPGHRGPAGAAQPAVTMKPQVFIASILLTQVVAVPILNGNQGKEAKPEEDVKLHGISSKQATAKDHSAHYKIAAGVVKQQVQLLVNLSDPFFENEQYHDEDIEEERINFRSSCIFRVQILKKTQLSR